MKQLQFYKYTTWALLFLNISMILFFFLTRPKPFPPRDGGKRRAIDMLKMDEQQHDIFLEYVNQHIQLMDGFDNQQRNLLKPYFNTLVDSTKNTDSDNLLGQALQMERKKIESTYQHLQDIKSILRPEQQAAFEAWINSALEVILLDKKKPLPPKGN